MNRRHGGFILGLGACAIAASIALASTPAFAHGPTGVMTVLTATADQSGVVQLEVGIVYENDDDPAQDATVFAQASSVEGTNLEPIPLLRTEGSRYAASVPFPPGNYTIVVSSTEPTSSAEVSVVVPSPIVATTTIAGTLTTTTSLVSDETTTSAALTQDASDEDSNAFLFIAAALVVAALVAAIAFTRRRRR